MELRHGPGKRTSIYASAAFAASCDVSEAALAIQATIGLGGGQGELPFLLHQTEPNQLHQSPDDQETCSILKIPLGLQTSEPNVLETQPHDSLAILIF